MSTKAHRTGQLGSINFVASIAYLGSFFLFGTSDSAYRNKAYLEQSVQYFGLVILLTGLVLYWINRGRASNKQTISEEIILDENIKDEIEDDLMSRRIRLGLNGFNLFCGFSFAFGIMLRWDEVLVEVLGLVYAIIWILMGLFFIPMAFKGERALYGEELNKL